MINLFGKYATSASYFENSGFESNSLISESQSVTRISDLTLAFIPSRILHNVISVVGKVSVSKEKNK
jgi:hypothetical protein